jgi:nitrogen fixation protein FixH
MSDEGKKLTGRGVFLIFAAAFGVIISVNIALAVFAARTFPGLEVKNSYVASQNFDARRTAQEALGWTSALDYTDGVLSLGITDKSGAPAKLSALDVLVGRTTSVAQDQRPEFTFDGLKHQAKLDLDMGNWLVHVKAKSLDGTAFEQRLDIFVKQDQ